MGGQQVAGGALVAAGAAVVLMSARSRTQRIVGVAMVVFGLALVVGP